jgi:F-type H+-transporting ATPase subunit delta
MLKNCVIEIKGNKPVIKISRVAIRYSTSFFDAAVSAQLLDQVEDDFKKLADLVSDSIEVFHALSNPTIPRESLEKALRELSEKLKLQQLTTNRVCLLAQRRRANFLMEIIQYFNVLLQAKRNQLTVDITARSALNQIQLNKIKQALNTKTGKDIILNVSLDEGIIGGIIVNYGSYKLDFSLKSKLNELKHELERLG